MKFTDKFTFITVTVTLSCIGLILVGVLFSLHSLSSQLHQNRVDSIAQVIEAQLDKHNDSESFDAWLPDLLDAAGIVRLEVKKDDQIIFKNYAQKRHFFPEYLLLKQQYTLPQYPNVSLDIYTKKHFQKLTFSVQSLIGVGTAILLSLMVLFSSIYWIKKQFKGAELLEKRAQYILQNNPTARYANPGEWPKKASEALDMLHQKLENAKKESSHFDAHIRSHAFLDETTGIGNRLAFENQLNATVVDASILSSSLILITFSDLESIQERCGEGVRHSVLLQITELLSQFISRFDDPFYGRIAKSEFVLILPQMSYEETKITSKSLTNLLLKLTLPMSISTEDFFYIGVVNFYHGEKPLSIMDDLSRASTVAKHQKTSGWFLADQDVKNDRLLKGTVRWRALLEEVLEQKNLLLYQQSVISKEGTTELYTELLPRITGIDGEVVDAGIFLPMAEKCGLDKRFDLLLLEKILKLLVLRGESAVPIAINLSGRILTDKLRMQWFTYELMQLSRAIRKNLVIEVSEQLLVDHYLPLRNILVTLQKLECKTAIDQVGRSVVNTAYIVDFSIDYLKLHPGLVRDIQRRKTNQLALQSLVASCLNSHAKVIAVSVEQEEEWKCLLKLGVFAGQGDLFAVATPLLVEGIES